MDQDQIRLKITKKTAHRRRHFGTKPVRRVRTMAHCGIEEGFIGSSCCAESTTPNIIHIFRQTPSHVLWRILKEDTIPSSRPHTRNLQPEPRATSTSCDFCRTRKRGFRLLPNFGRKFGNSDFQQRKNQESLHGRRAMHGGANILLRS